MELNGNGDQDGSSGRDELLVLYLQKPKMRFTERCF